MAKQTINYDNIEAEIKRRKKEKDEKDACIFTLVFTGLFQFGMIMKDPVFLGLTILVFGLILYMESRKEKVEKRLEVIKKAYYEQLRIQQAQLRKEFEESEDSAKDNEDFGFDSYAESEPIPFSVTKGGKVA